MEPGRNAGRRPAWLESLVEEADTHRLGRKLLVCRRFGDGREALRALASSGVGWIGFEPTTPYALASRLASPALAAEGVRVVDEFDEAALLDEAIDTVLRDAPAPLGELADGPGFRQAVADAIRALRLSGIDAGTLTRVPLRDAGKRDALVRIHDGYERLLSERRCCDRADVLRRSIQALIAGTAELPDAHVLLMPGQSRRGLSGRLLDALEERGARELACEAVKGLERPRSFSRGGAAARSNTRLSYLHDVQSATVEGAAAIGIELFAAASLPDEVREVLRRIREKGLRYDEVEIIATDAVTYGAALDGIARRLEIPVSYAVGLPAERTRPGRAVHAYLRWVREGFPAEILRDMLERGDLASGEMGGPVLARRLRRMQIGRGRERTAVALERAERMAARPPEPDAEDERTPEELERDRAQERDEVNALVRVVRPILDATPDVPDPLRTREVPVRPCDLARGLRAVLDHLPSSLSDVDRTARKRLLERLERIELTATRATTLDAAVAILESKLETRVPAPDTEGNAPWGASGGHLHLSDLDHGGWTNRPATFVVGLDASRFPGAHVQGALLEDDDRRRLSAAQETSSLPTSAERLEERRWAFAQMLARLRGEVTLSYSAWEAAEARTLPPSAELLQAFRLSIDNPSADYRDFHDALRVVTAVPAGTALDADDVWLGALSVDGLFRRGTDVVCAAFPHLARGLAADAAFRKDAAPGAYHGFVSPRPALDPRWNDEIVLSASRLEALGTCPLRYLLRNVLRVYPPDDPVLEPDAWLTPLERGSLLHTVFEQTLRHLREANIHTSDERALAVAENALETEVAYWRERTPPPGDAVFGAERAALEEDVRAFVHMLRERGADWVDLEASFGTRGEPPALLRLPEGELIRLRGAIDRIDRTPDGLVVIDYKTGRPWGHGRQDGVLRGGRRLQHVLYSAVVEALYDEPVVRAEYHFPTVRGAPEPASYTRQQLERGLEVVQDLIGLAASGQFHPTTDPADCRFCDYVRVCRVRGEGKNIDSPPAAWANEAKAEELEVLRRLRGTAK